MGSSISVELELDQEEEFVYTINTPVSGKLVVTNQRKKSARLQNYGRVYMQGRSRVSIQPSHDMTHFDRRDTKDHTFWTTLDPKNPLIPKGTMIPPGRHEYPFSIDPPRDLLQVRDLRTMSWEKTLYIDYILRAGCPPQTKDIVKELKMKLWTKIQSSKSKPGTKPNMKHIPKATKPPEPPTACFVEYAELLPNRESDETTTEDLDEDYA